jgi:hypothetical protein
MTSHTQLLHLLEQSKASLDTLASADLNADEMEIVLPVLNKFTVSALSALARLRQQRDA